MALEVATAPAPQRVDNAVARLLPIATTLLATADLDPAERTSPATRR